jgi:hypothetical protein
MNTRAPEASTASNSKDRRQHWFDRAGAELLGIALGFGLIWLAFAPGLETPDSAWIFSQARGAERINDWLSPIYAWVFRGLHLGPTFVWVTVTLLVLVTLALLLELRYSRLTSGVLAAAIAISPPVLGWLSGQSRDVWFGLCILAAIAFIVRGHPTSGPQLVCHFSAVSALCFFALAARQNAAPTVVVVLSAALFVLPQRNRWLGVPRSWQRGVRAAAAGVLGTLMLLGVQSLLNHQVIHPRALHPDQFTYASDLAAISLDQHRDVLPRDVWLIRPDLHRLAIAWSPTDGGVLFYGPHPPFTYIADIGHLRSAWLSAIKRYPLSYLNHRVRLFKDQVFLIGRIGDPFIPGMVSKVPGQTLARPHLTAQIVRLERSFWNKSGLRLWLILILGALGCLALRRTPLFPAAVILQCVAVVSLVSLVPTAASAFYRFAWLAATAALVTFVLGIPSGVQSITSRTAVDGPQPPSDR